MPLAFVLPYYQAHFRCASLIAIEARKEMLILALGNIAFGNIASSAPVNARSARRSCAVQICVASTMLTVVHSDLLWSAASFAKKYNERCAPEAPVHPFVHRYRGLGRYCIDKFSTVIHCRSVCGILERVSAARATSTTCCIWGETVTTTMIGLRVAPMVGCTRTFYRISSNPKISAMGNLFELVCSCCVYIESAASWWLKYISLSNSAIVLYGVQTKYRTVPLGANWP